VGDVVGTWVSDVRPTAHGPMSFRFRLAADGNLEISGKSEGTAREIDYHRSGSYSLNGDRLRTSVINEGRPAHVRLREGQLFLTIDETLAFRLRRE